MSLEQLLQNIWNDILAFFSSLGGAPSPALNAQVTGQQQAARAARPTITVEQARARAVASETNLNPKELAGWMSPSGSNWDEVIRVNHQIYLNPAECGGSPQPNLKLSEAVAAAGIGAKIASLSPLAAGGGPVGLIILGVGIMVGLIQSIFSHHRQAVERDIRAQCSLIPAANNALDVIIGGVQNGQISAADGVIGMQQLPQVFLQQAGAAKNNHPYCNGVCGNLIVLRAICFYWQSQFEAMS